MQEMALVSLGCSTIAVATPLLLAATGEIVAERAGVINVGIEGMMLVGAFAAFAGAHAFQSPLAGVACAGLAGVIMAGLFALLTVRFLADQVVVGTALNMLAFGLTGVVTPALNSLHGTPSLQPIRLGQIGHTPFNIDALSIFAVAAVPVIAVVLNSTRLGLRLRAAGEYPAAAADAGASIQALRSSAVLFGGLMAGVAGACLSIAYTVGVAQGMTNGQGFIALAIVIVGRWSPVGALLASLLFGAASAAQAWGQAVNLHLPYQLLLALPYLVTLGALVLRTAGRVAPAALGKAYEAE